jgi:hypothetical protein
MFEAYAIGITLKVKNLVSPQLLVLSEELKGLHGLVGRLQSTLLKMGGEAPGIAALGKAVNGTNVAFEKAAMGAAALERRIAAIKAHGLVPMPALGGGGGGGSGGGGRGNYGNHRGGYHGGNIHMGPGGIGLGTVGLGAGDAFVPLAVTAGMIYAGHAMYESAKDLNTEQARFKLFGLGDKVNSEAFKFVEGMKVYGTTQAENMKVFREAQGVFRESGLSGSEALDGAKLAAPVLAKIQFATESLDEEAKARMRTSSMSMLRWVEMSGGLKSAERFNQLADFGWKMVQTSGGAVDWEQLRQFAATAGNSGRFITPEGLAALEPIMGEFKGGRAGTSLRTAFNRLNGIIRLPNQAAHELMDNGIWDSSMVELNSTGGIKKFLGNPFKSSEEFMANPVTWYEKYMIPMYDKMKLTATQRARENALLFGSTGGALFTQVETALPSIHRSVDSQRKALGIDRSVDEAKKTLSGEEREFQAAWTDFKTVFGTVMLPVFTTMLQDGAKALRVIGDFVRENGEAFATIGKVASFIGHSDPTLFGTIKNVAGGVSRMWGNRGGGEYSNEGRNYVARPSQAPAPAPKVSLVLREGGRPLAETLAGVHSRAIASNLGTGSYDLGISQPAVSLRTN